MGARATGADPIGALFALNAPFGWDMSERLAHRIKEEAGGGQEKQIEHAYLLVLSRPPDEEERQFSRELLSGESDRLLVNYCHLLLGLNEFIYVN